MGASLIGMAGASTNPGVCAGTHLFPPNDHTKSITVTAPEGKLISGYCVKAGSIKQGNGPFYDTVDPPSKSETISHPSGKDISHYTVTYVTVGSPTTTVPGESTTTTTTVPPTTVPPTTTTTIDPPTLIPPMVIVPPSGATPVPGVPTFTG